MIEVHSSAFQDGDPLPLRFAARGAGGSDASPPLSWTGIPAGTASLAVTCVDHHPVAREFLHWIVVDLPADLPFLAEGASLGPMIPAGARELVGTAGRIGYVGPRPPKGSGPHPYEFTVWALDLGSLPVADDAGLVGLLAAVDGRVLGKGSITGTFEL